MKADDHRGPGMLGYVLGWALNLPALLCLSLLSAVLISCTTTPYTPSTVAAPPQVPGATFVGNHACSECHDKIHEGFHDSPHGRFYRGDEVQWASIAGCESCHGAGSKHVETGLAADIVNPRTEPQACLKCHVATHGEFTLPHHHRVLEGKMTCVDCHEPHGRNIHQIAGGLGTQQRDAVCIRCHKEQTRTHVFEHEALREGCVTCHNPHGSVNRGMLVQRDANLCLRCHAQVQTGADRVFIGKMDHTGLLRNGTCWSAGCHSAVHGSNFSPRLLY
ncbi:MAG TPA: hypothetical protein DCP58_05275 [Verrucomicrobiales bacterium]|nr:hypothetical protein [Verrucomicrobiales bacterium]|tara:strand:- start:1298 stop:2125 length:828 start_codon:yes stop_codon:yes gene_type:complete